MKAIERSRLNGHCEHCRRKGCSWLKRFVHRFVLCDNWTWTNPDKEYWRKKRHKGDRVYFL